MSQIPDWLSIIKRDPVRRDVIDRIPDSTLFTFRAPPTHVDNLDKTLNADPLPPQALVVASPSSDEMYSQLQPFPAAPMELLSDPCLIIGADMNSAPDSVVLELFQEGRAELTCCRKHADGVAAFNRYNMSWKKAAQWSIKMLAKSNIMPYANFDQKDTNDILFGLRHPVPPRVLNLCHDVVDAYNKKQLNDGKMLSAADMANIQLMRDLVAAHATGHEHAPSMPAWISAVSPRPADIVAPAGTGLVPMGDRDERAAADALHVLTHELAPLASAYQGPHVPLAIRPTSCQSRGKTYVDHILYGRGIRSGIDVIELKSVLDLPPDRVIMPKSFSMPNSFEPSDHFALMARFSFLE